MTGDALSTAGNMYVVHGNTKMFKPTRVAKTVAKGAVRGSMMSPDEAPHCEFPGTGPGDGRGFGPALPTVAPVPPYGGFAPPMGYSLPNQDFNPPIGFMGHSLPPSGTQGPIASNENGLSIQTSSQNANTFPTYEKPSTVEKK